MYLLWIYCVLLFSGLSRNFVNSTEWIDDLMKCIVSEDFDFKQVTLMTRITDDEWFENRLIDELFIKLTRNLPMMRINFNEDFDLPVNSVPDENAEGTTPIDTSATLFLVLMESRDSLPIPMAKKFVNAVAKMSSYHYNPKYLIMYFGQKPSDRVDKLLQYAWTKKKILDLTVIELVEPKLPRTTILIPPSRALPITHQLDPFKKEYTHRVWSVGTFNLFPKKVTNMMGQPLMINAMPEDLKTENDIRIYMLNVFMEKLNCSVENVPMHSVLGSDLWNSLYTAIERSSMDLLPVFFPHVLIGWNGTLRTTPIIYDEFCALVPILPDSKIKTPIDFFLAYILSFFIIFTFWIIMRWLRFKSYSWQAFNIARVLFGVSVAEQPRGNVERIMFACLLAIFAMYSSSILALITDFTFRIEGEVPFETMEDLDSSGLTPMIHGSLLAKASSLFTGPLKSLEKDVMTLWKGSGVCALLLREARLKKSKSYICFDLKNNALATIARFSQKGRPIMKLAKPCFWNENLAFPVGKGSPYRARLDEIILRSHSAGLISKKVSDRLKLYEEYGQNQYRKYENTKQSDEVLLQQLMTIAIVGYSLSLIVFFGELIWYSILEYRKSRRLRKIPLFPFVN